MAPDFGHKDRDQIVAETSQFLHRLISEYFDPIIEWILATEGVAVTNRLNAKDDLLADFRNWFEQCLSERLNASTQFLDVSPNVLNRLVSQARISPKLSSRMPEVLDAVFLSNTELGERRNVFEQLRPTMTVVVLATQDLALELPRRQLPSIAKLTGTATDLFLGILERVEHLRRRYWNVDAYPNAPRDIRDASNDLQVEVARYNGQVWLPLLPMITAPLSEQDLEYYSRDEETPREIAFHIVAGDGVMLVSGYRGVGKSSFVNLVAERFLREVEANQPDRQRWTVVPIRMSLAKTESVAGVLRLCVRTMYDVLLSSESPYAEMLMDDEMQRLALAYVRSTFKFGQQHKHSQTLSAEAQAELQVKLTEVLSKLSAVPLPSFKGKLKRVWSRQVEQTIGLLDYDEERAEEDIAKLITLLTRPRSTRKMAKRSRIEWLRRPMRRFRALKPYLSPAPSSTRIKLVFVFDELDKMDEDAGQIPLVKQLKNLFLARNTVFVLITSKKFYYRLLEERRQEDAMLSSYFSWMTMVPLFGSRDTERLIEKSIAVSALQPREREFVTALAQCLTYRSMGVPRDIVRELRNMQKWVPNSLQAFLSDQTAQLGVIRVYAEIQKVLEDFDSAGATLLPTADSNDQHHSDEQGRAANIIAPERLWLNDARREQIRHGLYVLVEELLDRGFLECDQEIFSDKDSVIRKLYDANFDLSTRSDFLDLLTQLAYRLPQIRVDLSGNLVQMRSMFGGENSLRLFDVSQMSEDELSGQSGRPVIEGTFWELKARITVSPSFYRLTGRRMVSDASLLSHVSPSEEDIIPEGELVRMLYGESGQFAMRRAVAQLGRETAKSQSPQVEDALFGVFLNGQDPQVRLSALQALTTQGFLREARRSTPIPRLQQEQDELILRRVIELVRRVPSGAQERQTASEVLLALIAVVPREWSSSSVQGRAEDPLGDVLSALASVSTDDMDMLEAVVKRLKPGSQLSQSAGNALMVFQERSSHNLLDLFVKSGFDSIPSDLLERLIKREPDKAGLWTRLLSQKARGLARQALAMILGRYAEEDWKTLSSPILQWLNSANWNYWDQAILKASKLDANSRVLSLLEREVNSADLSRAKERLPSYASQQGTASVGKAEAPMEQKYRSNGLAAVAVSLLILLLFFWIPVDVAQNATMLSQLIARFLELVYLLLGFASIACLATFFIFLVAGDRNLWLFVLTLILGALSVGVFLVLTRVVGNPVTIAGQLILALVLVTALVLPFIVLRVTRKPVGE